MKKYLSLILTGCVLLSGCNDSGESSSPVPSEIVVTSTSAAETAEAAEVFPVEVCGVTLEEAPKRVISLSPAATEIIAELGYTARLRGISSYCDYPELNLQTVGSSENPDIDIITGLTPDAVFTLSGMSERDIYAVNYEGGEVICLEPPTTIEGYGRLYYDVAAAFGGAEQGTAAAEKAVNALRSAAKKAALGDFIYVTDKLTAAGADTFENAVLSLAGSNLCASVGYTELTELAEAAPKYIIASDNLAYEDISADDNLAAMISNGAEVLFVTASVFERPSARTANIFTQLEQQLSGGTAEAE